MPRWKYHDDFRITARFDCNFRKWAKTLPEALEMAEERRDRDAGLSVHVDVEFLNVKSTLHVGFCLYEVDGKTLDQIWDYLDLMADQLIAAHLQTGHWRAGHLTKPI